MSEQTKAFPVSWDQFHRDCKALAWRLADNQNKWDVVVAITRGGLVPAAIIARELGIRNIETVCVASYHTYKSKGEIEIIKPINPEINQKSKNILVIDDLTDTGATSKEIKKILPNAHIATVYAKPLGRNTVDTFVTEVSQDTWIYFPWDMEMSYVEPISGLGDG